VQFAVAARERQLGEAREALGEDEAATAPVE